MMRGDSLPAPILKHGQILVLTIPPLLTDSEVAELRDRLLSDVGRYRSAGVLIDVSALDMIDSFFARLIREISGACRLRGALTVVVGIQPAVAFTMVQAGSRLEGVSKGLDFEDGLALLERQLRERT